MKLILTDIDDTILRFGDSFQDWVEAKGLTTYGRLRDLCCVEDFLGCDRPRANELITECSLDPAFMENLRPEPDALEYLPKLHAEGWRFIAITSCVNDDGVAEMRAKNIKQAFGFEFEDVLCTGLLQPKAEFLARFDPTYWVEDNAHHAVVGADLGHTSILLDRPYNRHLDGPSPIRVNDWEEIYGLTQGVIHAA